MAMNNVQNGRELVELGLPEVWIKRTPGGQISSVKAELVLREANKEIAFIEGTPMITAAGYYRANTIASLAILTPDTIKIPGEDGNVKSVPNPFPIIDRESGTQKGVWVKKLVVGYTPIGSIAVSSTTMFYDFRMYFLQDLQNKVQYNKGAGRLCYENQLTEEEKKTGIFVKIEGPLGVWASMEHPDVLKAVRTWLQNKNFGERKAQTIAERNALKHHPALSLNLYGLQGPENNRWGKVGVIGWQHDHDFRDLEEIALAADAGEKIEVDGKPVETIEITGQVEDVDVQTSDDDEPEGLFDDRDTFDSEPREGLF